MVHDLPYSGYFSGGGGGGGGKIFVVFVVERRTMKFLSTKQYHIVLGCGLVYRDHEKFSTNWPKIHCSRKFHPPKNTRYTVFMCVHKYLHKCVCKVCYYIWTCNLISGTSLPPPRDQLTCILSAWVPMQMSTFTNTTLLEESVSDMMKALDHCLK